jgi:hypothetical protein
LKYEESAAAVVVLAAVVPAVVFVPVVGLLSPAYLLSITSKCSSRR